MVDLKAYVITLLIIAAIGMVFILRVLKKQISLFRYPIMDREIRHFRYVLFLISIVIIVMGLIPISINVYSLFAETERPDQVPIISLVYSLGVHIQSLLLSYLLWQVYKLAANERDITKFTDKQLSDERESRKS
jgi:hypothetical protein